MPEPAAHDTPEFAPPEIDLDRLLVARFGPEITRIVRALRVEHHALDTGAPLIAVDDRPVLLVSTADKIVALDSLARRADRHQHGGPAGFFAARPRLLRLLPHLRAFHAASAGHMPASMTQHLGQVLDAVHERVDW